MVFDSRAVFIMTCSSQKDFSRNGGGVAVWSFNPYMCSECVNS